jgi:hypothetical protein
MEKKERKKERKGRMEGNNNKSVRPTHNSLYIPPTTRRVLGEKSFIAAKPPYIQEILWGVIKNNVVTYQQLLAARRRVIDTLWSLRTSANKTLNATAAAYVLDQGEEFSGNDGVMSFEQSIALSYLFHSFNTTELVEQTIKLLLPEFQTPPPPFVSFSFLFSFFFSFLFFWFRFSRLVQIRQNFTFPGADFGPAPTAARCTPAMRKPAAVASSRGRLCTSLSVIESQLFTGQVSFYTRTYNGQIPAPTLRIRAGDRVQITLQNNLNVVCNETVPHALHAV